MQPLKPFPQAYKPPADLIPVAVKAGKKVNVDLNLRESVELASTALEEKDEFEQKAEAIEMSEEDRKKAEEERQGYIVTWQIEAQHKDIQAEIVFYPSGVSPDAPNRRSSEIVQSSGAAASQPEA